MLLRALPVDGSQRSWPLDFAESVGTASSSREECLIEVLGRVHVMEMAASAFFGATNLSPDKVIFGDV
jgi:hypothetical protein